MSALDTRRARFRALHQDGWPAFTVADLAAIGVRRVSVGGALAAAAWAAFKDTAAMLRHQGAMPPRPR